MRDGFDDVFMFEDAEGNEWQLFYREGMEGDVLLEAPDGKEFTIPGSFVAAIADTFGSPVSLGEGPNLRDLLFAQMSGPIIQMSLMQKGDLDFEGHEEHAPQVASVVRVYVDAIEAEAAGDDEDEEDGAGEDEEDGGDDGDSDDSEE